MFHYILKIVFLICLITLFLSFFGIPSLSRYLEKRYVFSDNKVDFDLTKPPAIIVYHSPINETSEGNRIIIDNCINRTGDDYKKSILCVNKNLADKNEIIINKQSKDTNGRVFYLDTFTKSIFYSKLE